MLQFYICRDVDEVVRISQGDEGGVGHGKCSEKSDVMCDGQPSGGMSDVKKKKREFKESEPNQIIIDCSSRKFAQNSNNKIKWAVNLYSDWRVNRLKKYCGDVEIVRSDLDRLNQFSKTDLNFALCRFIKKLDGNDYSPNTLRKIVIMVQMYLQKNGIFWKLLDQSEFVQLCNVLDNTMKERHATGLGVCQSSKIITLDHENKMFNQGILGESNPQQLLDTMIYMIGMHCALRGGLEHNKLQRPGCNSQFYFEFDERGVECLVYKEDPLQKTNQGGLVCKGTSKIVYVYAASDKKGVPFVYSGST